ncbi:sodium/hydrogen exchanger 8 isoform X1 [Electrophorus electricus]|uniref:Sodium/hydrogen exchanger n=1 Tax=Electrophorus electricus TaxID=8005 RepID=A0A4W4H4A5_ELEEL|nr:sodium/hydrogen exchanger 8 isoform X1 [Electrophorus electricus]XP_026880321.1 sodium/hydrogen exchanger 8 isoform X1 [Electrophorus electricus]XP_026880322.1 sodium/hydrogen exchanger 8 isoform X1 [Electrophorus electricus]
MTALGSGGLACVLLVFAVVWTVESVDEPTALRRDQAEEKQLGNTKAAHVQRALTNTRRDLTDQHSVDGRAELVRLNTTTNVSNETVHSTTPAPKATTGTPPTVKPILPVHTGVQAQEEEQSSGMSIFFSLLVIGICIVLVHLLIKLKFHFLPESVAVVSLGILMGAFIKIIETQELASWKEEEMFRPNMFFLLLLPPIIFESGYSLHKGNFFQNIGSITLFAVIGTAISAFIVGGGIYFLGQADVIYKMSMTDSFAFGSLISAVDPVATIAIFNALNVDPVLNMLVFGESILNDAVSIVLTNTAEGFANASTVTGWETFLQALGYFLKMFFGSAALGTLTGLISAICLKHVDLRNTPSLEFGMMLIFAYLPYGLSEGIKLSGIMAILFSGIVMSHYTHHNLSPVTQLLMQQTLRTVAFMCETCVFAFLGLSIFSFPHKFEFSFVIWCIVLVLVGRAVNIFPLSFLLNFFRDHKITPKMMFIMWFSGLRGAIPYALSLHLGLEPIEKRQLIGTTTIVIVLFTILLLGGGTMPLMRILDIEESQSRRRNKKDVNLSKTEKMGNTIESEHLSELTEEEYEAQIVQRQDLKGFLWLDAKYLNPFFTRRLTQEDLLHGRIQMKTLTNKWYEEVRQGPSGSEDEDDEAELL